MRIRAFLAIECSSEIQTRISKFSKSLPINHKALRWVAPANIHLTIRFFESIENTKVHSIKSALEDEISEFPQFSLNFCGVGGFPGLERCRVLWVGIGKGNEECIRLKNQIDHLLVSSGFPKEHDQFIPHVTIARLKTSQSLDLSSLVTRTVEDSLMKVEELILFQSELTSSVPKYTKLAALSLAKINL